jgi:hypothetical protein
MLLTRIGCGAMMAQNGAEANDMKQFLCHVLNHGGWRC